MNVKKTLVVIMGNSGAGKDTYLVDNGIYRVIPRTTRLPRPSDLVRADTYCFVSNEEASQSITSGDVVQCLVTDQGVYFNTDDDVMECFEGNDLIGMIVSPLAIVDISRNLSRLADNVSHLFELEVKYVVIHCDDAIRQERLKKRDGGISTERMKLDYSIKRALAKMNIEHTVINTTHGTYDIL